MIPVLANLWAGGLARRVGWRMFAMAMGVLVGFAIFACSPLHPSGPGAPARPPANPADLGPTNVTIAVEDEDDLLPGVCPIPASPDAPANLLYRLALKEPQAVRAIRLVGRLPGTPVYCATFVAAVYQQDGSKFLVSYRRGRDNTSRGTVRGTAYFLANLPRLAAGKYTIEFRCLDAADALPTLEGEFVVPTGSAKSVLTVPAPLALTEKDNGRIVQAKVGQEIQVRLADEIGYWRQDGEFGGGGGGNLISREEIYSPEVPPGRERTEPGMFVRTYMAHQPGRFQQTQTLWIRHRGSGQADTRQEFAMTVEVAEDFANPYVCRTDGSSSGWGPIGNGLRIRIVSDGPKFIAGQPIRARLELECVKGYPEGRTSCQLNRWLYLNLGKETRLLIVPPNMPLSIQQGTVYSRPVLLSDLFPMNSPGKFSFSMRHIRDGGYLPDDWTGSVHSQPTEIEVLADTPENRRALGVPAGALPTAFANPPESLPGSALGLGEALVKAQAATVCEASGDGFILLDPAGAGCSVQQFRSLLNLRGTFPQNPYPYGKSPVGEVSYDVRMSRGERLIRDKRHVIWLLTRKSGRWSGIKALEDTPENRQAVQAAADAANSTSTVSPGRSSN